MPEINPPTVVYYSSNAILGPVNILFRFYTDIHTEPESLIIIFFSLFFISVGFDGDVKGTSGTGGLVVEGLLPGVSRWSVMFPAGLPLDQGLPSAQLRVRQHQADGLGTGQTPLWVPSSQGPPVSLSSSLLLSLSPLVVYCFISRMYSCIYQGEAGREGATPSSPDWKSPGAHLSKPMGFPVLLFS